MRFVLCGNGVLVCILLRLLLGDRYYDVCPMNSFATVGGLSVVPATSPLCMSAFPMPLTFIPMLSPGSANGITVWCISSDLSSPTLLLGMKISVCPGFRTPVSNSANRNCADACEAVNDLDRYA